MTARAAEATTRRRATTTGKVLLGVGGLVSLPLTAFGALWSLWAWADGSVFGAIVMLALAVGNGLSCGALFFVGGAVAEFVACGRERGGGHAVRLWNWCFGANVVLGSVGMASLIFLIVAAAVMAAEQPTFAR